MLDEAYNETDVLLQKSLSPSTRSDEKTEVILAIRLADSSFQTLLRFSLQSTVDAALAQVRQSLIRVGQIDEKDTMPYALFRVQGPNERRLEPPSSTLAKFDLVNRDVLIYQVRSALEQADSVAVLLIGADAGRPLAMSELDQRVQGLPRKLHRPRRQLHCQASFFRAADKRRYSLLLLFNDVLVLCKPKSSVSRLVDRVRTAIDTRVSREDNLAAAATSPVLVKTSRHGASYHGAASPTAAADDGFEYVMSFELQFLHIREQAACTAGLSHAFAVFGTSRFDHPPTTAARPTSPRLGVDDDAQLDQLPGVALQFSTSAERIDFLAELRKVIRAYRTSFDVDGDFGDPNELSTSARRSVFTSLKRQPQSAAAPVAKPAPAATTPAASAAPKSPARSPPASPRTADAAASSPPLSPRAADVSAEQGGSGSLRKRAVAQSPRPVFANKPEPSESEVRSHVKQLLVSAKAVRTATAATSTGEESGLLKVQLSEYDDMCARLDVSIATPYRALYSALHEFVRCVDEHEPEAVAGERFHDIVEKARTLMNTTIVK